MFFWKLDIKEKFWNPDYPFFLRPLLFKKHLDWFFWAHLKIPPPHPDAKEKIFIFSLLQRIHIFPFVICDCVPLTCKLLCPQVRWPTSWSWSRPSCSLVFPYFNPEPRLPPHHHSCFRLSLFLWQTRVWEIITTWKKAGSWTPSWTETTFPNRSTRNRKNRFRSIYS